MSDLIAAIATGNVLAGIGIIRLSGEGALRAVDAVFDPMAGTPASERRDRQLVYGRLHDAAGRTLDWCLTTVSRAPNSYTGEDTAELQCHGSPMVLREGLNALFAAGARQAKAGEFTRRAFLNGKLDLTQAEAVIDLIHADTAAAAVNAAAQLGGAMQRRIESVYSSLADISAHYHAVIDYPDEDIEPFELAAYEKQLSEAAASLSSLLKASERGKILREGVSAALIGAPNAGKSSLLNALVGFDRAIVTPVPGTTRDTVEESTVLGGVKLRLTDTAGLRDAADEIERLGVERSRAAAERAELVIAVIDGSRELDSAAEETLCIAACAPRRITVLTKSDIAARAYVAGAVRLSSVTGEGLDALEAAVAEMFAESEPTAEGEILTNTRQTDAVARALDYINAAREALADGFMPDAVLTETEGAMTALGELTGRTVREDVTDRIFERFCVGK